MVRETVISQILDTKLIAIVRGIEEEKAIRLAQAILDGGIRLVEVTFNQSTPGDFSNTLHAISAIDKQLGDKICVGAGTVLTPDQVKLAAGAGAQYIISPDANPDVIKATRELGLVSIPGALTPTDITFADRAGADFVKLFPVGVLGSGYVKAIRAPLNHIKMLAVGGVNENNIPEFLAAGCLGFGIGGNLVNRQWIDAGQFDKITETAKAMCKTVGK